MYKLTMQCAWNTTEVNTSLNILIQLHNDEESDSGNDDEHNSVEDSSGIQPYPDSLRSIKYLEKFFLI